MCGHVWQGGCGWVAVYVCAVFGMCALFVFIYSRICIVINIDVNRNHW